MLGIGFSGPAWGPAVPRTLDARPSSRPIDEKPGHEVEIRPHDHNDPDRAAEIEVGPLIKTCTDLR